jgi:hypothetical protein
MPPGKGESRTAEKGGRQPSRTKVVHTAGFQRAHGVGIPGPFVGRAGRQQPGEGPRAGQPSTSVKASGRGLDSPDGFGKVYFTAFKFSDGIFRLLYRAKHRQQILASASEHRSLIGWWY